MIPLTYYSDYPPSVIDDPLAFFISLCGLMTVSFCFCDWTYKYGWALWDDRQARDHPLTMLRIVFFSTGLSGLIRNGPDVLSWGLWKTQEPATRFAFAHYNRLLDGISAPIQSFANIILGASLPVIVYQLAKEPLPVELYPTKDKVMRQVKIVGFAMFFSVAIALYRK